MCVYDLSHTWVLQVPNYCSHAGAYENRPAVACAGWHPESLAGEHASLGRVAGQRATDGGPWTRHSSIPLRAEFAQTSKKGGHMHTAELVGYLASALVFATFYMKTMMPLRAV